MKEKLAWMVACEIRKECETTSREVRCFLKSAAMTFVAQFAYVIDRAIPRVDHGRPLGDAILREIVDYIHSNLHRNVTLSELSALVHLTPRYFCGVFKQATGRPPHQYLIE